MLNWAGKADAYRALQAPTFNTLSPCPSESVDFDATQNVFIEAENLEALKILQKSYAGKVKMIYIDPPYNTGSDSFVYPDKFGEKLEQGYQLIIADLMKQLAQNPEQFFTPDFRFASENFIGERELTELLMRKVMLLALERNVRSPLNANIIPSDLNTLPDAKRDFLRLVQLAYFIANARG